MEPRPVRDTYPDSVDIVIGLPYPPTTDSLPVLEILKRLRFTGARYDLVHALPPPVPVGWPAEVVVATEALLWNREEDAARILGWLAEQSGALSGATDAPVSSALLDGSPVDAILHHADEKGAELVAVDATDRSAFDRLIAGSVARGIVVHARQSVLVARQPKHDGPLNVVFATDHSPFADQCAVQLARMGSAGINTLTIASAWPEGRVAALEPLLGQTGVSIGEALREALVKRNEQTVSVLRELAKDVRSVVVPGDPNSAIRQVVEETGADLLVLGAKGHGMLDRLTVGSVSLHQALHSPVSVLIVR